MNAAIDHIHCHLGELGCSRSDVIDSRNIRVKDANGEEVGNGMSFKLKFQTISRKGHWRETGNLLVDTVGEHSVV